jgi:hypothetical protein
LQIVQRELQEDVLNDVLWQVLEGHCDGHGRESLSLRMPRGNEPNSLRRLQGSSKLKMII